MKSDDHLNIIEHIISQRFSSLALTQEYLKRIEQLNPDLNLFITILKERALEKAKESNSRVEKNSNKLGRLEGIPIAIKDNFFIKDIRCTAGSKILSEFIPNHSAFAVDRLESSGAVIIGTTNLHEFASGVTSVNPHYGPARNPWARERITGGSSGGSAAAVASGFASVALGSDTSGSVRIPASLCGVVGLKPTFGLVSTSGTIPLASSLDHVGILSLSCVDAGIMLDAVAGFDPNDPMSVKAPRTIDYYIETLKSMSDLRTKIGIPKESYFFEGLDPEVEAAFQKAKLTLRSLGYDIVEDLEIQNVEKSRKIWAPIRFSEATSYHEKWLNERPNDYGQDVRKMLERGKTFSALDYISAKKRALELKKNMLQVLSTSCDVLLTPTTSIPAPRIGELEVKIGQETIDIYSSLVRNTLPFNLSGLPAVSVPMGFTKKGLPLGLQLAGRPFEECLILGVGGAFQKSTGSVGIVPPDLRRQLQHLG